MTTNGLQFNKMALQQKKQQQNMEIALKPIWIIYMDINWKKGSETETNERIQKNKHKTIYGSVNFLFGLKIFNEASETTEKNSHESEKNRYKICNEAQDQSFLLKAAFPRTKRVYSKMFS